jgi:predicted permease
MRAHHWLLRLVSRIVPRDLRDDWLAEWDAELSHHAHVVDRWRQTRRSSLDLLRRASGAFWDALWLRSHRWSSVRLFGREWRLAATAVLSLATAIAAVVVGLAAYDAFLVRPPGVADPASLRSLFVSSATEPFGGVSFPEYRAYQRGTAVFEGVTAFPNAISGIGLTRDHRTFQVWSAEVSDNFFEVLGATPGLGALMVRAPRAGELAAGDVVIGDALWRKLGADPAIVGHTLELSGVQVRVAGVASASFHGMSWGFSPDVWMPFAATEAMNLAPHSRLDDSTNRFLHLVGRLRSGVSDDQVIADAGRLAAIVERTPGERTGPYRGTVLPISVTPPGERRWMTTILGGLLLIVLLALVVACANVTNLLLGLAIARRHEMVVRAALGASRLQLALPLVREGAVLGFAGGLVGCGFAWVGLARLATLGFSAGPIVPALSFDIQPRLAVFAITLVIAIAAGAGAAMVPAIRSAVEGAEGLVRRAAPGSPGHALARRVLVVIQMTVCTLVLAGLGLAAHSLFNLRHLSLGFAARNLVYEDIDVARTGYTETTGPAFHQRILEQLWATPGIAAASLANAAPLDGFGTQRMAADGAADPGADTPFINVDQHYFSTIQMPVLEGRGFDARDRAGTTEVAVVNQTLARTFWPHQRAIGRFLRAGAGRRLVEVIGVVPDGKYGDVDEAPRPFVYLSLAQHYVPEVTAIVRTSAPRDLVAERLRALEPHLANGGTGLVTLDDFLQLSMALPRAIVWAAMVVGVVALVLTIVALYSTAFYAVGQRRAEIGIRTALGASPAHLFQLVLAESARVAGIGAALGLVAAYFLTPLAAAVFVGIGDTDPAVLAAVALVCAVTTIVISILVIRPWTRLPASALLRP